VADQKTDNHDFGLEDWSNRTVSWSVRQPAPFRFIRLTQRGKRPDFLDTPALSRVEFFGTLYE
jgi:hypothetical protein